MITLNFGELNQMVQGLEVRSLQANPQMLALLFLVLIGILLIIILLELPALIQLALFGILKLKKLFVSYFYFFLV